MISLFLAAISIPDAGAMQHAVGYRLGVQSLPARTEVLTVASTLEGGVRITDRFGVEAAFGVLFVGPRRGGAIVGVDDKWLIGNPMVRVVYAGTAGELRLRLSTGFALPLSGPERGTRQGQADRAGLASAIARSGAWDYYRWAPRASTWVTSLRMQQPIGPLWLGIDAHTIAMAQGKSRLGGRIGGDVSLRPIEQLEVGFRFQGAGMLTEGDAGRVGNLCIADDVQLCDRGGPGFGRDPVERVLEEDVFHLSIAPWVGGYFGPFQVAMRFTINVSDTLGFEAEGGPLWGFDLFVGVGF